MVTMVTRASRSYLLLTLLGVLALSAGAAARAQTAAEAAETASATSTAAAAGNATVVEDAPPAEDEAAVTEAAAEGEEEEAVPAQYPFRDLPADVLRDFPGLCFGSTALRLFQVGQSWSLTPFCGVATCLVSRDGFHLIERVQDCGPQPKRNPKCTNTNARSEAAFPNCCPVFECEEGTELEYPTQDELQQLAHEAAQAAVRAQYEEDEASVDGAQHSGRVSAANEEEPAVGDEVELDVAPTVSEVEASEAAAATTTTTTSTKPEEAKPTKPASA